MTEFFQFLQSFLFQPNALKAITPATLDVLMKILSSNEHDRPTNEQRQEMLALKDLVLKCAVRMVHVIHCCSPDQVKSLSLCLSLCLSVSLSLSLLIMTTNLINDEQAKCLKYGCCSFGSLWCLTQMVGSGDGAGAYDRAGSCCACSRYGKGGLCFFLNLVYPSFLF